MPVGKEISLIAFLDEVVSRNTQHYKSDFELDAQKLRDALDSPNQDERVFYFMSRPNGTWCVLERDAFLRRAMATRYGHIMQICLLVSKPTALSLPGSAEQLLWAMW